ncbi:MAG: hypothetical protein RJA76_2258 [Bacteroidota bacterium]|jgi:hypothetical protein
MKKLAILILLFFMLSCSRHDTDVHDDNEGITTVQLTFTPTSGNAKEQVFEWKDGAGELIELNKNAEYDLSVSFLNESGLKTVDLTEEVKQESDAHLVVLKPTPQDLFSVLSTDKDSKGRKLGLKNKIKFKNASLSGGLRVILLHQPPVSGKEVKDGTNESIGSTDIDVNFSLVVK